MTPRSSPRNLNPTDDPTPLRTVIPEPDHDWFPCQHCGKMNKCPPVAMPVKVTTALTRRRLDGIVAEELDPDRGTAPTVIVPKQ